MKQRSWPATRQLLQRRRRPVFVATVAVQRRARGVTGRRRLREEGTDDAARSRCDTTLVAHKVKLRRARQRVEDTQLCVTRLRGFGFVAECSCGEQSGIVGGYAAARAWARLHVKMREHVSGEASLARQETRPAQPQTSPPSAREAGTPG